MAIDRRLLFETFGPPDTDRRDSAVTYFVLGPVYNWSRPFPGRHFNLNKVR
jgi:hypothetical protein